MAQQRREFLVRGRNHLDVMTRLRVAMRQNNFRETLQSTETSATFYAPKFMVLFFSENVTFTATPDGEDTRLVMVADVAPGGDPTKFLDQVAEIASGEVSLEEA